MTISQLYTERGVHISVVSSVSVMNTCAASSCAYFLRCSCPRQRLHQQTRTLLMIRYSLLQCIRAMSRPFDGQLPLGVP